MSEEKCIQTDVVWVFLKKIKNIFFTKIVYTHIVSAEEEYEEKINWMRKQYQGNYGDLVKSKLDVEIDW